MSNSEQFGPSRIAQVMVFPNGMVATFDQYGQQMPDYQGTVEEVKARIIEDAPPGTVFFGASWVPKSKAVRDAAGDGS